MKKVSLLICLLVLFGCSKSKFISVYNESTVKFDENGSCQIYPKSSSMINRMRLKHFLNGKELNIVDTSSVRSCQMVKADTTINFKVTKGQNTSIIESFKQNSIKITKYSAINIDCPMSN